MIQVVVFHKKNSHTNRSGYTEQAEGVLDDGADGMNQGKAQYVSRIKSYIQ